MHLNPLLLTRKRSIDRLRRCRRSRRTYLGTVENMKTTSLAENHSSLAPTYLGTVENMKTTSLAE